MEELLQKYKEILRLQDWDITLHEDSAIDSDAENKILYNADESIIRIKSKLNNTEQEKSLIHELLHLIFRDEWELVHMHVEDEKALEYLERQHERAIEKMAQIIYKLTHKE